MEKQQTQRQTDSTGLAVLGRTVCLTSMTEYPFACSPSLTCCRPSLRYRGSQIRFAWSTKVFKTAHF